MGSTCATVTERLNEQKSGPRGSQGWQRSCSGQGAADSHVILKCALIRRWSYNVRMGNSGWLVSQLANESLELFESVIVIHSQGGPNPSIVSRSG